MAISSGVVVWPVEIADIQRVAGVVLQRTVGGVTQRKISGEIGVLASAVEGETVADDAGGTAWTVVSRIPINVWAKYKPVRYSYLDTTHNPSDPTQTWLNSNKSWKTDAYVIWWRNPQNVYGDTIYTCGFAIPASGSISENIVNDLGAWEYLRPRGVGTEGGVSYFEPRRLLDFNQYLPSARCPFQVSLPTIAVLSNNLLSGKCRFRTPSQHAYNLTLNDIFGQGGGAMYFGVAVVIGTAVWSRTQEYGDDKIISLEGLESKVSAGMEVTLVAFATRRAHPTWSNDTYPAYSLNAPGIDFNVVQQCKIVSTFQTQYAIVITGLQPTDHTVLMPNFATANAGWVTAANRSYHGGTSPAPTYNYSISSVKCTCELVDISLGTTAVIDEVYYEPNGPNANITVEPTPIEHRGGPYPQMRCSDNYHVGEPADPTTQYYQITYTFIYEQV